MRKRVSVRECVCVRKCVYVRERVRESVCVCVYVLCECVCVLLCVSEYACDCLGNYKEIFSFKKIIVKVKVSVFTKNVICIIKFQSVNYKELFNYKVWNFYSNCTMTRILILIVFLFLILSLLKCWGGRDKVEFFKVDKGFWPTCLGQNWRSHFRLTQSHYDFKVDTENLKIKCFMLT